MEYCFAPSNWTITLATIAPNIRNAGSNTTHILPSETIKLYAQGYDGKGLSGAWLWTNETGGSGKNYTLNHWNFTKYSGNPIYTENGNYSVRWVVLVNNGSTYFLFYSHAGGVTDGYYATSTDGTNFVYKGVALSRGTPNTVWDSGYIEIHTVMRYNSTHWIMYYCGCPVSGYWSIGCAFSTNLINWVKYYGNPIYTAKWGDYNQAADPKVVRLFTNTYYMYYGSYINYDVYGARWHIVKAISSDGLNFTRIGEVLSPTVGTWYNYSIAPSSAILETGLGQIELMVIGSNNGSGIRHYHQIGMFTSNLNGVNFSPATTNPPNPCIPVVAGTWEQNMTIHSTFCPINRQMNLYYEGNNGTRFALGKASFTLGSHNSPVLLYDVKAQWTWTNFTWHNSSIAEGTTIRWRIYYCDSSGLINATVIQSFVVARFVSITVTSSPSGSGYVSVDNSTITTPHTFTWQFGESHTLTAISPVTIVAGQSRYVFLSWSDSGERSHTYVVPYNSATVTSTFQLQYYLNATGGNAPLGSGWKFSATTTAAPSTLICNTISSQSRNTLTNWQLNDVNQNPAKSNTQHYLTVSGGNGVIVTGSQKSDQLFDSRAIVRKENDA
jgi:hypothetical protein